jgi:hypothetical protein
VAGWWVGLGVGFFVGFLVGLGVDGGGWAGGGAWVGGGACVGCAVGVAWVGAAAAGALSSAPDPAEALCGHQATRHAATASSAATAMRTALLPIRLTTSSQTP